MNTKDTKDYEEIGVERNSSLAISRDVITAAMKVHNTLGPGMLESAYETCLAHELRKAGHRCETQVEVPIKYDGIHLDVGYRLDLLVDEKVIVEIKAVEKVNPVSHAQLISYLKLSNKNLGLLLNFNVVHMKDGIKRFVRGDNWKY